MVMTRAHASRQKVGAPNQATTGTDQPEMVEVLKKPSNSVELVLLENNKEFLENEKIKI